MELVFLTALGVGGATVIGAVIGFLFKKISLKFSDIVLAFAAGVMLAASVLALILPSLEYGGKFGILPTTIGIFCGALCIDLLDKFTPFLYRRIGSDSKESRKVLLFVTAIAIHNLPEGIAAGVGFGAGDIGAALLIAGSIALQNIPEGMVIIGPMLAIGMSEKKTFFYAAITGVIEVIGTLIGYFAVSLASAVLPFALAFAGGTMLYVICDDMIPETHTVDTARGVTYALIVGFCLTLAMDAILN